MDMLQIAKPKFKLLPEALEEIFMDKVIENYFNHARLKNNNLITEIDIADEMIEMINRITSIEYFEDELKYRNIHDDKLIKEFESFINEQRLPYFFSDIVTTLEWNRMSYFCASTKNPRFYPAKEVW